MRQIVELTRSQGATELLTSYALGDRSPAGFYEALGFVPTGAVDDDGEVLARLPLDGPVAHAGVLRTRTAGVPEGRSAR